MASLGNLSDDELRNKLREHGITSPVTTATRKILLKKLNHIISNKDSPKSRTNSTPTRVSPRTRKSYASDSLNSSRKSNLNAYSSDEDENEEIERYPSRNESWSFRSEKKGSYANSSYSQRNGNRRSPVLRKRAGNSPLSNNFSNYKRKSDVCEYDTGSDSDIADDDEDDIVQDKSEVEETNVSKVDGYVGNNYSYKNDILKSISNHTISPKSITSRLKRKYYEDDNKEESVVFQEKLLNNAHLNGKSRMLTATKYPEDNSTERESFWSSVPLLLVGLLALFFCILGLCYISIHYPLNPSVWLSLFKFQSGKSKFIGHVSDNQENASSYSVNLGDNKFPVCRDKSEENCVTREELNSVLEILGSLESKLLPTLARQAARFQCGEEQHLHVSLNQVSDVISEEFPKKSSDQVTQSIKALEKLSQLNPHWGLKPSYDSSQSGDAQLLGFEAASYPTEIMCHVKSALYSLVFGVVLLAICVLLAWLGYRIILYYRKRSKKLEQESFELVERILEVLENSCGTSGKEYIAVNHVRDCLIPPRERRLKSSIWNKAVHFIDEHDSRVYRDIRSVSGEDCEVWRWVSGAPRSSISCSPSTVESNSDEPPEKIWQGQAFDNPEATANLPQTSPTSCLKVRNMFDCEIEFGENWPRCIQDSLLEKCENAKILHVSVDRASKEGCVYLKCASAADAGKAFRALHGCWFDGNLVTVKYLREERYHERFPTARIATIPLTPSNNKRLSLQNSFDSLTETPPSNHTSASRRSIRRTRIYNN